MDYFAHPPECIELIGNDDILSYYSRRALIVSCKYIQNLARELGKDQTKTIKLPFSSDIIRKFLTLLLTEKLPKDSDRDKIALEVANVAAYMDLIYLDTTLNSPDRIIDNIFDDGLIDGEKLAELNWMGIAEYYSQKIASKK